jgi:ATP-dependent Clp protease ATP-binding subunit ClpC
MPQIQMKVPTLVKELKNQDQSMFQFQPLFLPFPKVVNKQYSATLAQYKKQLKLVLKGSELSRTDLTHLLWYHFSPTIKYSEFHLSTKIGQQIVEGTFGVATFEMEQLQFVYLPSLQNYMFISNVGIKNEKEFKQELEEVIKKKLMQMKQSLGNDLTPEHYLKAKREFITYVKIPVNVTNSKFRFELYNTFSFYRIFNDTDSFSGEIEIEKVGECINYSYPKIKRSYFREKEVEQLYSLLFDQSKRSAVALVGEMGTGKKSLIQECLYRYLSNREEEEEESEHGLWDIDPNRIIAGMSIVGSWQRRFEAIINYVKKPHEHSDLSETMIFNNPVALLRIGKSSKNAMTLSDVLKPHLETRSLNVVLVATPDEWKIIQEKDRRFADLFQVLRVTPPNLLTAVKMVLKQRAVIETTYNCQFTIQAIHQLFTIQRAYIKQNALPGSVMKLVHQLAIKYEGKKIDLPEVRKEFKSMFGLQEHIFEDSEKFNANEINRNIAAKLIGQEHAVQALTDVIHLLKAKLNNPDKPIASLIFIGPTGVGKTQAAKVLCEYLLGSEEYLLRLDMNEYIDAYAVSRLIGNEINPEGILTGRVRYRSFGVLLLDEIEKAHPAVYDLLLQVLDDGRLTDSLGRVVNFSNLIIIMTSNIGSQEINKKISVSSEVSDEAIYRKAIERHFRPEFINRIDRIVTFQPLEKAHILNIARLQIKALLQRDGFMQRSTILNITEDTLEWLAEQGYDKSMGGRAMKRKIEHEITALSAEQLNSIKSNIPIIFNIAYNKKTGRLIPNVHHLQIRLGADHSLWSPFVPNEKNTIAYYWTLQERMNAIKADLFIHSDQEDAKDVENWKYYQLDSSITEIRESLTYTQLKSGVASVPYITAMDMKWMDLTHPETDVRTSSIPNNVLNDLITKLRDDYKYKDVQFSRGITPIINYQMDIELLEFRCRNYFQGKTDQIRVEIKSLMDGFGDKEVDFLLEKYEHLLKALEASSVSVQKNKRTLFAEGHGLYQLMQIEAGIHFMYYTYQTHIPIQLSVSLQEQSSTLNSTVVRLYDNMDTVTDLRSGYIVSTRLNPYEHKFMLLSACPLHLLDELDFTNTAAI